MTAVLAVFTLIIWLSYTFPNGLNRVRMDYFLSGDQSFGEHRAMRNSLLIVQRTLVQLGNFFAHLA